VTLHHLFMLLAVGVIRQTRASWVAAGPLGFSWHGFSFPGKRKPRKGISLRGDLS
jgi:hypothetical protein